KTLTRLAALATLSRGAGEGLDPALAHGPGGGPIVPPTVSPSMRSVGWPTPTGTPWPSLPQVPTPSSSLKSLPIIVTLVIASGPLPISVAPLTAAPTFPSSIRYASEAEKTNLPEVISTLPPPNLTA